LKCEISGSHGGEYEDGCLLGCCAASSVTEVSEVFAASIIRAIIALMVEAASTSEMSVNFYQTAGRKNPEDNHLSTLKCFFRIVSLF
jgi:hypothetical protein